MAVGSKANEVAFVHLLSRGTSVKFLVTGQGGGVTAVAFGPNVECPSLPFVDGTVDVEAEERALWEATFSVNSLSLSLESQKRKIEDGSTAGERAVSVRAPIALLATGANDGSVRIWAVCLLTMRAVTRVVLGAHTGKICCLSFCSPRDNGGEREQSGKALSQRAARRTRSGTVASVSQNIVLATGSADKACKLWNLRPAISGFSEGAARLGHGGAFKKVEFPIATVREHSDVITNAVFSCGGEVLFTASWDGRVLLHDIRPVLSSVAPARAGQRERRASVLRTDIGVMKDDESIPSPPVIGMIAGNDDLVTVLALYDSTSHIAVGLKKGKLRVFDLSAVYDVLLRKAESQRLLRSSRAMLAGTPKKGFLGGKGLPSEPSMDMTSSPFQTSVSSIIGSHEQSVNDVSALSLTPIAATASKDRAVHLWNMKTGTLEAKLTDNLSPVMACRLFTTPPLQHSHRRYTLSGTGSGDLIYLATAALDSGLRLYNVDSYRSETGKVMYDLIPAGIYRKHSGGILTMSVSEDGIWLACGGRDKSVSVHHNQYGDIFFVGGNGGHTDDITSVAFGPTKTEYATLLIGNAYNRIQVRRGPPSLILFFNSFTLSSIVAADCSAYSLLWQTEGKRPEPAVHFRFLFPFVLLVSFSYCRYFFYLIFFPFSRSLLFSTLFVGLEHRL